VRKDLQLRLIFSGRSKRYHGACWSPSGAKSAQHRCPKSANSIGARRRVGFWATQEISPLHACPLCCIQRQQLDLMQRTAAFKAGHTAYCLPRICWLFQNGGGYWSKFPVHVFNVSILPFFSSGGFMFETGAPLFILLR
jgi:hypothetical protein